MSAETATETYIGSDGTPVAETEAHLLLMLRTVALLRAHFRTRPDVYVVGNVFWYYREDDPLARKAPDVMVVKGVDPSPPGGRGHFKSWEEKAIPCFILEFTSRSSADDDAVEKKQLFEQLGVREYFLFDPHSEYLERPLMGYRLIGGRYEPLMPAADSSLPSNELGIRFRPDGAELQLIEMKTGRRLEDLPEVIDELTTVRHELELTQGELERRLDLEEQIQQDFHRRQVELSDQLAQERRQAEDCRREADQERQRADALAAELARLRAQLPLPPGDKGQP